MNDPILRVFLSSTSVDLEPYRAAARDEIQAQGWYADMMESFKAGTAPTIEACQDRVRAADAVVVMIAFRRGWVPSVEQGGDGRQSIVAWELAAADKQGIPVLVFMANDTWPGNLWEPEDSARAWLYDFRASFNRFASFFDFEQLLADQRASLPVFRSKVRDALVANRDDLLRARAGDVPVTKSSSASEAQPVAPALVLRPALPPKALPSRPYPLLEAYDHPATLAARDDDVSELNRLLTLRQPLICVHAPSGAGKSSVLHAGLLPRLSAQRIPVALDLHVDEPGLSARLLNDLAEWPDAISDAHWDSFAECIVAARAASGVAPVFILDQFEQAFRTDHRQEVLARLGPVLASTFRRFPAVHGPVCRWVLAYRQDFHGEVMSWLEDVLVATRLRGNRVDLPHDLRSSDRCVTWALPVLGQSHPGGDAMAAAVRAFTEAIEKPLQIVNADGSPHYPWRIERHDARRLAEAFAEQRVAHPDRPLTPQFQVVLGQLLDGATLEADGSRVIRVPSDPTSLVRDALEAHLKRSLEEAFPATRGGRAREERTRALLALREMCESDGRRGRDVPEATLSAALGQNGAEMIERLTSSSVRLIVPRSHSDGTIWYSLPHDSLAAVISKLFQNEARLAEYSLDKHLVELWRLVAQRSEYYQRTEDQAALDLSRFQIRAIIQNRDALLWDDTRTAWLRQATEARARRDRRLRWVATAAAVVISAISIASWWSWPQAIDESEQQIRERARSADSALALEALSTLVTAYGYNGSRIVELLNVRTRRNAMMVLADGPRSMPQARRLPTLLPVLQSLFDEYVGDSMAAGAMLSALDHYDGDSLNEAREFRQRIADRLRTRRRVPPIKQEEWARVSLPNWRSAGGRRFQTIPVSDEAYLRPNGEGEFLVLRREVTVREYLTFDPAYQVEAFRFALTGQDAEREYEPLSGSKLSVIEAFPVIGISWFEAYAYAAWLGGTLPSFAQWQETCALGFPEARNRPQDRNAGPPGIPLEILDQRAWFNKNRDRESYRVHPVAQLRPDALGLYDLLGNADEWSDDWLESQRDKTRDGKPVTTLLAGQVGGDVQSVGDDLHCSRAVYSDLTDTYGVGFRVVLPAPSRP